MSESISVSSFARICVNVVEAWLNAPVSDWPACASACRAASDSGLLETSCQALKKFCISACMPLSDGSGIASEIACSSR